MLSVPSAADLRLIQELSVAPFLRVRTDFGAIPPAWAGMDMDMVAIPKRFHEDIRRRGLSNCRDSKWHSTRYWTSAFHVRNVTTVGVTLSDSFGKVG